MADKKITDLPVATGITSDDISVLVGNDTDYQFSFASLLSFVNANITVGARITFGTVVPQNTTGANGDVYLKTDTAGFYQKIIGSWALAYTITGGSATDGTLLYGNGIPGSATGANNDSYIDKSTGIFYLKTAGAWAQVFSMATGPQGPQGTAGTNGINGTNGHTILSGTTDPANSLGGDGDFYINTSLWYIFGPKAGGVWPDGESIIGNDGPQGAVGPEGPAGPKGDTGETGATGANFNMTSFIQASPTVADEIAAVGAGLAPFTMYKTLLGELRYKLPNNEFTYSLPFNLS